MKKVFIVLLSALAAFSTQAQNWALDNSHSSVKFSITHLVISEVEGDFKKFTANVTSEKPDFTDAKISFSIDANSINTDNTDRDNHLRAADFFDVAKYPSIDFKSSSIKKLSDKKYELKGEMTLHGVTKPVTFAVMFNGTVKDPYGNTKAGFKCTTTLKRSDFNLSWNKNLDNGGLVLSDEVAVTVNIELAKK